MAAFFHGWRRKAGGVTLVMALAAMGLWIRSLRICDTVEISTGVACYRIVCRDGQVDCVCCWDSDGRGFAVSNMGQGSGPVSWISGPELSAPWELIADNPGSFAVLRDAVDVEIIENGTWLGFRFQKSQLGQFSLSQATISHWAIVIPLTVLAACLILVRPSQRNACKTVGPSGLN